MLRLRLSGPSVAGLVSLLIVLYESGYMFGVVAMLELIRHLPDGAVMDTNLNIEFLL